MLKNDLSPVAVGKRLTVLRVLAGLDRPTLAAAANVGKTSISFWEHGKGSPMTASSAKKIVKAVQDSGIICSEEWLRTGNGKQPVPMSQLKALQTSNFPIDFNPYDHQFAEEINIFLSSNETSNPIVIEVKNNTMSPVLKKGDVIGGLFVPVSSVDLAKENICIVKTNDHFDVRRVTKGSKLANVNLSYLSMDSETAAPFEISDVPLEIVAPVSRVWR